MDPIRGKVAQILDSRQIAINVGSLKGVTVDMVFKVVNPEGEQIRDPDTDEILGSVESPKIRVRVTEVQDKLSVATTSAADPEFAPIALGPFAKALLPPRWAERRDALRYNLNDVKVGDPVVQVVQDSAK